MTHWVVSDSDLGKVSVAHQAGVVQGYICTWLDTYVCGISK